MLLPNAALLLAAKNNLAFETNQVSNMRISVNFQHVHVHKASKGRRSGVFPHQSSGANGSAHELLCKIDT